jgi:hypothetical protein
MMRKKKKKFTKSLKKKKKNSRKIHNLYNLDLYPPMIDIIPDKSPKRCGFAYFPTDCPHSTQTYRLFSYSFFNPKLFVSVL